MPVVCETAELEKKLCAFIADEFCDGPAEVDATTPFETLGLDSICLMELVIQCERLSGQQIGSRMLVQGPLESVRGLVSRLTEERREDGPYL